MRPSGESERHRTLFLGHRADVVRHSATERNCCAQDTGGRAAHGLTGNPRGWGGARHSILPWGRHGGPGAGRLAEIGPDAGHRCRPDHFDRADICFVAGVEVSANRAENDLRDIRND